jgi:lysophospholipase L1-like esterase
MIRAMAIAFVVVVLACGATTSVYAEESRGVRLTVAGDSLALGVGASDSSRGFAFDLFRRIRKVRPGSEVSNLAIGGATANDVARLELDRIAATHPDIIILEVGANDLVRRHAASAFGVDYLRLARGVRRVAPHARIVLFNVPDIAVSPIFEAPAKPALRRLARAYNATVVSVAKRIGAAVVDLFKFSQAAGRDPARYFSADQFHPSDDGHAAIASDAWPTLQKMIAPVR